MPLALTVTSRKRGRLPLEFAEDGFFVIKQIANQPIGVAVFERQSIFGARPQDAGREGVCKVGDVVVVGGGEVNEAGKVGGDGVEGGDVVETELAKG